jgi:hypothetical protein
MGTRTLAVVCAWCNRVITTAPVGASVSHTICQECLDWTFSPERQPSVEPAGEFGHFQLPDRYFGFGDDAQKQAK